MAMEQHFHSKMLQTNFNSLQTKSLIKWILTYMGKYCSGENYTLMQKPVIVVNKKSEMTSSEQHLLTDDIQELCDTVYDLIKDIRDPEKPETLEELDVVYEGGIKIKPLNKDVYVIEVEFIPTVPHCSLATLIGLCIRVRLQRTLPDKHKLDIFVKEGTHDSAQEINKQVNDKERVAAALENPNLVELVEQCLQQD